MTAPASLDSELRYFAVWYVMAGVLVLRAVRRIEAETTLIRIVGAALFAGGCVRLLFDPQRRRAARRLPVADGRGAGPAAGDGAVASRGVTPGRVSHTLSRAAASNPVAGYGHSGSFSR